MDKKLYDQINDAIKNRGTWSNRQQTNYQARNGGIRRKSKPYPGAPDGWYPLGDTLIEKLKPAYIQQLYGSETIAAFVCLRSQDEDLTSSAGYWYDYQLKQRSNFERSMFVGIDQMLEQSFSPFKVYFDAYCKQLAWEQIDPLHLIVPEGCQEYNQNGGTDWMVHVLHLSVAEYKANSKFKQDEDFIDQIKGKGKADQNTGDAKKDTVDRREGINCSTNNNEIVLWEVYNRDRKDKKITVETISPLLPCEEQENEVRPSFGLPYNKGIFKSGQTFPFFKIRAEIKGKGHYSSRGIIEINMPFEMSLTKSWNTMHEHMDFSARPVFENTGVNPMPNAANFKVNPGSILPPGLKLAVNAGPPPQLRESMEMTRAIAEDRTQVPDLGAGQHLSGDQGAGGKVTATQINAIVGQSGQGNDMRARVFRLDLNEGLNLGWGIALQYLVNQVDEQGQPDTKSLQYLVDGELQSLDQNALHEDYEIALNGSADSWNKSALVQKRMGYYQLLQQNPYTPLDELTKFLLEADDPKLVKRLFRDPKIQAKGQESQQMIECLEMEKGFVPDVNQGDDDKTHLMIMDQYAKQCLADGTMTPKLAAGMLKHGPEHMGALMEKKDPMLKQIEMQLKPTAEALSIFAAQAQPNVIQMQQPAGISPGVTQDGPISPTGPAGPATPATISVTNQ